jgi:GntR family transcriptional regulator
VRELVSLNPNSGVPIYVQLVQQLRRAIEVGSLEGRQKLPTVRELSQELGIAPNTVVKAYGELRRVGLVESRPGVGTLVIEDLDEDSRRQRVSELYERVEKLVREAAVLGVTEDDLWDCFSREFGRLREEG